MRTARTASESRGGGPGVAAAPATTASGTAVEIAACLEEGATGAAAAAENPRQAARAVTAAPPCFRGHQYNVLEILHFTSLQKNFISISLLYTIYH